jgi:hypothetical protein
VRSTDPSGNTVVSSDYTFSTGGGKFALLIGEGGVGLGGFDITPAVKEDLGEMEWLLRGKGFEIIGRGYRFGLGRDGILEAIEQLGAELEATGRNDNIVFVIFEGHGYRYRDPENVWHYQFVTTRDECEDWSLYVNKLDQETIKNGVPMYSKMIIVLQSCFSGGAIIEFIRIDREHRIVISATSEDDIADIVGIGPWYWTLFLDYFMNRLEGDWGACAEVFKWAAWGTGVIFVKGIITYLIANPWLIPFLWWTIPVAALYVAFVGTLVLGPIAAIGCSGWIMGDATIKDAFEYADAWANWGTGWWGWLGGTDDPHLFNADLASKTKL